MKCDTIGLAEPGTAQVTFTDDPSVALLAVTQIVTMFEAVSAHVSEMARTMVANSTPNTRTPLVHRLHTVPA